MRALVSVVFKVAASFLCAVGLALAQYPQRPIQVIVPFAAGGSVEIVSRIVSDHLAKALGESVLIDIRPGAAGTIGTQAVVNAKSDGYTLLASASIHVMAPILYPHIVKYDALNDLQPVSMITSVPLVLVSAPTMPFNTVPEMLAWGKAQPDGVHYAGSVGSSAHVAGELLGHETGLNATLVPYNGSGAAMMDVMAGRVPLMFDALTASMPHIRGGKLKALAVASKNRSPMLPDVPTFAELGYADFDLSTWHGFWAPRDVPKPVVDLLAKELGRISHLPDVEKRIMDLGGVAVGSTPEEFAAYQRAEYAKWSDLIRRLGVKVE